MTGFIYWDVSKEILPFPLPVLGRPVLWYGFFFALGFFLAYLFVVYLFRRFFSKLPDFSPYVQNRGKEFLEKLSYSVFIGALVGARLGDVLFYQDFAEIIRRPMGIFAFWEGGLASHGGVIGILIALYLFVRKRQISLIRILDISCLPACLAAGFIRIGNFFNQEILGKISEAPWAVCFSNPVHGFAGTPRHPVQLYESFSYFFLFFALWHLLVRKKAFERKGNLSGAFFFLLFSFRFVLEFFKEEQSVYLLGTSLLTMGQYLSIPFILLGAYLLKKADLPAKISVDRHHR